MIVLGGKGTTPDCIRTGIQTVGAFQGKQIEEYFHRASAPACPSAATRSPLLELQKRMIAANHGRSRRKGKIEMAYYAPKRAS